VRRGRGPPAKKRVLLNYDDHDDQMGIITAQLRRIYGGESSVAECVTEMKRLLDARLKEVQAGR
jgi:hypothetical protein